MSSSSTTPRPPSVDSEAKLITSGSKDEEPFVPESVQPCKLSEALTGTQGVFFEERLSALDKHLQRLLERTDEVHDMVAGLTLAPMTGLGSGTIGWAPSQSQSSLTMPSRPLAAPSIHMAPPGTSQQPQPPAQQVLPANRFMSTSTSHTSAMGSSAAPSYVATHFSSGNREIASLPAFTSNSSHTAQPSQATPSNSMDLEGVDSAQRAVHESHRKLCQRVQARLGLRHRREEVTRDCLHTALVTLGIEQYGLPDVEELVLELRQHEGVLADDDDGKTVPQRGRRKRRNDHSGGGARDEESPGIDFGFFMQVMVNRGCSDAMPMSPKSREMLKVVREVLLCGDANRLVAQLAQVRIDDLAAPNLRATWLNRLEPLVAIVIIVNVIFIGVETDQDIEIEVAGPWLWIDGAFTLFFLIEMVVKVAYNGCRSHLCGRDWAWNVFDASLVLLALTDTVLYLALQSATHTRHFLVLRVLRLIRLVRLFRLFQFKQMRELSLMVKGLVVGLRTLGWAIILLFVTVYVIAVFMAALMKVNDLPNEYHVVKEERLFATVPESMFTAFRCFVGDCQDSHGRSVAKLMADAYGWPFIVGYVMASVFVTFGVFNLIFAIYIETTLSAAKMSKAAGQHERYKESLRVAHLAKQLLKKFCSAYKLIEDVSEVHRETSVASIQTILRSTTHMDLEETHMRISKELFLLVIQDPEVQRLMNDLDIPPDRASLFDILDADGSGGLEATELIQGLLRVRGEARKSDVVASLLAIRAAQDMIREVKRGQEQLQEAVKRAAGSSASQLQSGAAGFTHGTTKLDRHRGGAAVPPLGVAELLMERLPSRTAAGRPPPAGLLAAAAVVHTAAAPAVPS